MLVKRKINDSIILIQSDLKDSEGQSELANAFLRFQEYFESPKFAGMHFTRELYEQWYEQEYGSFSYCEDWSGFNVPGHIFREVLTGSPENLSFEELQLAELVSSEKGKFYVIGALEGSEGTLKHEVAHALFYINQEYHKEVLCIFADHDVAFASFFNYFKANYAAASWFDETHAYLLTDADVLEKEGGILTRTRCMKALIEELETNFKRHAPKGWEGK